MSPGEYPLTLGPDSHRISFDAIWERTPEIGTYLHLGSNRVRSRHERFYQVNYDSRLRKTII